MFLVFILWFDGFLIDIYYCVRQDWQEITTNNRYDDSSMKQARKKQELWEEQQLNI